jgi:hypothetical protein
MYLAALRPFFEPTKFFIEKAKRCLDPSFVTIA